MGLTLLIGDHPADIPDMVSRGSVVSVRRRMAVSVVAVCAAVSLLGACGGGGSDGGASTTATTSAAPGANVVPNATGYVGGSINKAKAVATQQEQHDNQLQQQGGAGQP
jgi:hypothetical protein